MPKSAVVLSDLHEYPGISAKAFQHPADAAATAALEQIPLLKMVLKRLSEWGFERSLQQLLWADSIRIGERQLPELWQRHLNSLRALDISETPALYLVGAADFQALTIGTSKPMVVVQSGLVSGLDGPELGIVLAHEHGHVLSDHTYYTSVMLIVHRMLATGLSPIGRLPLLALNMILMEWFRCAELSSDRAAAIVVGDPLLVCQGLMRTIGGGVEGLSLDAFIQQAGDYVETEDMLARPGRFLAETRRVHPYAVRRVHELTRWVSEGDYDRIRSGRYVRRGEEPPPSDEAKRATDHYRTRFVEVIERVAGGTQRLLDQFGSWLRRNGADRDGGSSRAEADDEGGF
jgi:Zn-dependent protease with chaperone function